MSIDPVVWEWDVGENFCVLTALQNVPDDWQITKGLSRANGFPADARFEMDPKFGNYVALSDNIKNRNRMLVVSRRVKEFIEGRNPGQVEYLPVSILNHQKKTASAEYFVVHPTQIVDCIDQKNSKIVWNKIDPEKIAGCSQMNLLPDSIDWKHLLFRPKHLEYYVMIHPELAEALKAQGYTGFRFTPVAKFVT